MSSSIFTVTARDAGSRARTGVLRLANAELETPVFMPVGTQGSVKALSSDDVEQLGYKLILGNTYHLLLRPGPDVMRQLGGLRKFMNWKGAILTDSGGFQVFSLSKLLKIREEGVRFASHLDGTRILLTPELATDMQLALDSDIVMAFDECVKYPAPPAYVKSATERSFRWTQRSHERFLEKRTERNFFFGIVQGGFDDELRKWSVEQIGALDCDGHAIGGLSVGEPKELFFDTLQKTAPLLPEGKPRYLMGVGTLSDIYEAVRHGVDMFDCVMPTRAGRHGHAMLSVGGHINLLNARFKTDATPIEESCRCLTCQHHSRAYLHHLFRAGEVAALRLASRHNLWVYARFMERLRQAIRDGRLEELSATYARPVHPAEPAAAVE